MYAGRYRSSRVGCGPALVAASVMLLVGARPVLAQEARVTLQLDRSLAYIGEEVRVEVSIQMAGRMGYERYLPPTFEGFNVLGSGMSSQNIEIINMQVRRSESYVYTVTPTREGTLTVGPAAIMVGGRVIRSAAVRLSVKRGGPAAPTDPSPSEDPGSASEPAPSQEAIFIRAEGAPLRVYQGQELEASWVLAVSGNLGLRSFQPVLQPVTDAFWSEDLDTPSRLSFEQRVMGDQIYNVALLSKKKLFAQKPGKQVIGPMKARVQLVQFFNSREADLVSNSLEVEVLPLPEQGRPAGFVPGNVGQYDIDARLDRGEVKGGEAVTLTIVVRGRGNLRQLAMPRPASIPGFKVYEPKVTDNLEIGEKTLEYLLLPQQSGTLTIPALDLPTFDPAAGTYRVLRTRPLSVVVRGAVPSDGTAAPVPRKNVLGPSIRPPRPPAVLSHRSSSHILGKTSVLLTLLPVLLLALVVGAERLRIVLRRETPRRQQRAAARRIREHLRRARELLGPETKAAFFAAVAAAIRELLQIKLGARTEGLTREELRRTLEAAGFEEALTQELIEELDNCDFARFAPAASGTGEMESTLSRTRKLLDRLSRLSPTPEAGRTRKQPRTGVSLK